MRKEHIEHTSLQQGGRYHLPAIEGDYATGHCTVTDNTSL